MATPKQKIAQRQKANAAVLSNLSALRQGVSSIPGRVVKYIKTSTPSDVARDVGDVASSTFSALKKSRTASSKRLRKRSTSLRVATGRKIG